MCFTIVYWKVNDEVFNDYDNSFWEVMNECGAWDDFNDWLDDHYTSSRLLGKIENSRYSAEEAIDSLREEFADCVYERMADYGVETWTEEMEEDE